MKETFFAPFPFPLTQTLLALPGLWIALPASAQSTWNATTDTNWSTGTNWSPSAPAAGDDVIIADTTTGNLLTLDDGPRTIGSLTFGSTGTRPTGTFNLRTGANTLTFNGGVVANGNFTAGNILNVGGNVAIAANQDWTVAGELGAVNLDRGIVISNGGAGVGTLTMDAHLTKKGSGQLSLIATTVSGAGNFIVDEGALKLNAGSSQLLTVGGTGNITVNNAASLFVSRNSGTLSLTRDIVMNGTGSLVLGGGGGASTTTVASGIAWNGTNVLNLQNTGNIYVSSGAWSGTGSVEKTGPGTINLAGDHSAHGGAFTIASGRVRLGDGGTSGSLGTGTFTNNGIFEFNRSDDLSFGTSVSGTGSLEKSLANTVTLTGTNTYDGHTYIRGGTLRVGSGGALPSATRAVLTGSGSTLDLDGRSVSVAALHSGSSADTGSVVHLGTDGNLTVTGNSAATGITNTATNYHGIFTGSGDIEFNHSTNAQGAWNWHNTASTFTGDVTITSGRLRINPAGSATDTALGNASNRIVFNGNAVETFGNGQGTASLQQSVGQALTIAASREVVINDGKEGTFYTWGGQNFTVDAAIGGGGTLRKEDSGTLILTAANTYSGGTKLAYGIIQANHDQAFGSGDVVIGALIGSGSANTRVDLNGVTVANDFVINSTANTGFFGPLTAVGGSLSVVNGDVTISANVGNGGHLASSGAGSILRINGAINVTGGIIPNARQGTVEVGGGGDYTQFNVGEGTLRLVADNGVNSASHLNLGVSNSATFDLNGRNQTLAQLTRSASAAATVTNNGASRSTLAIHTTVDHTYSGTFSDGSGGFDIGKSGSGTFTLTGGNASFTGGMTVTGGTLRIDGAYGGAIQVDGGTLAGTSTIGGAVTIGSGTLAPGSSPGTLTITNALALAADSLLAWELNALDTTAGLGINDLVTGITNLTLDGVLQVTGSGDFTTVAEGTAWRLFEYNGTLDDRTLVFGDMPQLASGLQWSIDTGTNGQVNLLVSAVPEPSAVLLGALGGCFLLRRRR